jgi:WD40 repeat protein
MSSFSLGQDSKSERKAEAPKFEFKSGDTTDALQDSPDKKYTLKVKGKTAQLYDATTNKPVGSKLRHEQSKHGRDPDIKCWAFSPDGKSIATGAAIAIANNRIDLFMGDINIWEVPTGKLIANYRNEHNGPNGLGPVKAVRFSKDGKIVYYQAKSYSFDGIEGAGPDDW